MFNEGPKNKHIIPMGAEEDSLSVPIGKFLLNCAQKGNLPRTLGDTVSPLAELFFFSEDS